MTSEIKNRKNNKPTPKAEFKSAVFINHAFTADDKARFKEWAGTNIGELWGIIDRVCDDGFKVTVKEDTYNQCYSAFLQASDEKNALYGYILTGRSRSASMALLAVLFRHYVVFEADWPTDVSRDSRMDDE